MATTNEQITKLYIATFNRAPDSAGLAYWAAKITADGWRIDDVAGSMFDQIETQLKYPATLSTGDFVDTVYLNVLNRPSDMEGKAYWVNELDSGRITKNTFIIAILNGAESGGTADDRAILDNKLSVGIHFAITNTINDTTFASGVMEKVTGDPVSKIKGVGMIDAYIAVNGENFHQILGESGDDTINGDSRTDWIESFEGNDTIYSGSGENWVDGGSGNDRIYGAEQIDTMIGGSGNDTIYGGAEADLLFGENGYDSIHGEEGNDQLYGEEESDYLYGDGGDDLLQGGDGNDYLYGGDGDDTLYGGDGDDLIFGELGDNWIDGEGGNDVIYGSDTLDTLYGGEGSDTLYGGSGNDVIDGMSGNDTLYGGENDDRLNGNSDNDILYGGDGNDTLNGEEGSDILNGEAGSDILVGGGGIDIFVFARGESGMSGIDTVFDYGALGSHDLFRLSHHGSESVIASALDVSAVSSLAGAVTLASAGDGSTNGIVQWFQYQNNTYIVEDMSAAATFVETSDIVIKIQGLHDFSTLSDLTTFV